MNRMRGANAYARVGVESQALQASPHKLITMLFDGAQEKIRAARLHMQAGNIEEKGKAISKAMDIVNIGLIGGLDVQKGGEVVANLERYYDYISRLLAKANRENSDAKLEEASVLLETVGSAWREVGGQGAQQSS
ncbi:flagellar export chaperone FliS [Pseudomonas sp. PLMAX]|uniref:flagellar export chaperone FliS n=1 Tax=Pseudomonas sp. PLMAX TaxID=2201998 RepID=UPI0038BAF4BC